MFAGSENTWNPHSVELALWTHYVANEFKPELLNSVPEAPKKPISEQTNTDAHTNGNANQTKVFIAFFSMLSYIYLLNIFIFYYS